MPLPEVSLWDEVYAAIQASRTGMCSPQNATETILGIIAREIGLREEAEKKGKRS